VPEHDHLNLAASGGPQRLETVWSAFVDAARARPDAVAVVGERGDLTYGQLKAHADAVAYQLAAHGINQGDRVALLCQRDALVPAAMLGIASLGAVFVPIETDAPLARRSQVLQLAGCRAVISNLPSEERPAGALDLRAISMPTSEARSAPNRQIGPNDPVSVMFTSGSTGQPKGVLIPHRAIVRLARARILDLGPGCRFLHASSLAFDASTLEIWGPLLNGGTVVTMEGKPDLKLLERAFRDQGITAAWLTAALFHLCADTNPAMFAPLTTLLTGGDVVSPKHAAATLAANPHLRLINGYGPTENTTFTTTYDIRDPDPATPLPIGRPITGTEVVIVDEHLRPVPPGEVGELIATGEGLALGYLNDPELTKAKFITLVSSRKPGYRTGDLARESDKGMIEFLGRNDNQIKINGFRVEPGEIEAVLRDQPAVRDAAVVVAAADGEVRLHAFVTLDPVDSWPEHRALIRRNLVLRLPSYAIPASITHQLSMPTSATGKIDRRALRDIIEIGECLPADTSHVTRSLVNEVSRQLDRYWNPYSEVSEQTPVFQEGTSSSIKLQSLLRAPGGGQATLTLIDNTLMLKLPPGTSEQIREWRRSDAASLIESIINPSESAVTSPNIMSESEFAKIRSFWTEKTLHFSSDSIWTELKSAASSRSASIAIVSENGKMTFDELIRSSEIAAEKLARAGVVPGECIALMDRRNTASTIWLFAILSHGCTCVPITPEMPKQRADSILKISQATILVDVDNKSDFDQHDILLLNISNRSIQHDDYLPGRDAFILFTSGSTGEPKGVRIRHESVLNMVGWFSDLLPLKETDVVTQRSWFSWDCSIFETVWPLLSGGAVAVIDPSKTMNPGDYARVARDLGVTILVTVPSIATLVCSEFVKAPENAVRIVFCAGEKLTFVTAQNILRISNAILFNGYGPSEASIMTNCWKAPSIFDDVPIGKCGENVTVRIESLDGSLCPLEVIGEIVIQGIQVSQGYLQNANHTKSPFSNVDDSRRSSYRTGDLGFLREDGQFFFMNRLDNQIKIFGHRLELEEIESAILQTLLVEDVAVCTIVLDGEKIIFAICVKSEGQELGPSTSHLFAALRHKLESHALPNRVVFTNQVPRLANGKIDRRAVETFAQTAAQEDQAIAVDAGRHGAQDIRECVRRVWSKLLGHAPASDEADFIQSGGNSLLLLRMFLLLEQATGVQLARLPSLQSQTPASIAGAFQTASNPVGAEARYGAGAEIRANRAGHLRKLTDGPGVILAIPHLGGTLGYLANAAAALDGAAELYGILQAGLLPGESPLESVDDMIAGYADLVQAQGWMRLRLVGYSSGASIAVDLAQYLAERGVEVTRLFLVDGIPCHRPALHPRLRKTYSRFMWRVPKSSTPLRAPNTRPYDLSGYQHEQLALAHATIRALFRHTPARYGGRTTIVRTAKSVELAQADSWKRVITGPMDEVVLAGANHSKVWDPPHVDGIVDALRRDE
jgi:amino acid adenylation domain-containing protein